MNIETKAETLTLNYLKTIGLCNNGENGRGFAQPYDLVISRDGKIFVLNRSDPSLTKAIRIGICNLEEEYLGEFYGNGYGVGEGQFTLPVAIAFDNDERLYITDEYNHTVSVFDKSGNYLSRWGSYGSTQGNLDGPAGIVIDSEDYVYIVDQNNNRVQKFTTNGDYILGWGTQGTGEGQFNLPWGITTDKDGDIYVADWRNDRIQKFTSSGHLLRIFGESGSKNGQLYRPSGVAVDKEGRIYVADWGNERVQIFDPSGNFLLNLKGQATLSKWARDFLKANPDEQVTRDISNLIPDLPSQLSTPYDISSQCEPYFWSPVSIKLDSLGQLYVLESNRYRFQVYSIN